MCISVSDVVFCQGEIFLAREHTLHVIFVNVFTFDDVVGDVDDLKDEGWMILY